MGWLIWERNVNLWMFCVLIKSLRIGLNIVFQFFFFLNYPLSYFVIMTTIFTLLSPSQQPSRDLPARTKQRASVSDLKSATDISSLTIKQLKEILSRNFVDYKGCVERYELEERVTRLFTEKEIFKQKGKLHVCVRFETNFWKFPCFQYFMVRPKKKWFDWRNIKKNEGRSVGIFIFYIFLKLLNNHLFLRTDFWLDVWKLLKIEP